MSNEVILVHGLWFRAWAMEHLARELKKAGFTVRKFNYATTTQGLDSQSASLFSFAQQADGGLPHFVAHSMGGLITLNMLVQRPDISSGRIVLMGSPLKGSTVAKKVSEWPGGAALLGEAEETLARGVPEWPGNREVGMIAGTKKLGLGVLAGGGSAHGDGTVLAEESRHEDLRDHIEIPASHTSMLFSAVATRQVVEFLQKGHFSY
jgi:pimeloyl-ACP methyl ester carboxylesterase